MSMRLELHDRIDRPICPQCQTEYSRIYGTLYEDEQIAGRHSADPHHHDRDPRVLLAIGTHCWHAASEKWEACSVTIEAWAGETQYNMALRDASFSPYQTNGLLGRVLDRAEARASPARDQFFHLADHIVTDDPRVRTHLDITES
jgi:hypothetical protein